MMSVAFAALIIPAVIGLFARRLRFVALAGLVAECSVPFGFALEAGCAPRIRPNVPAEGDYAILGLIFAPFFALGLALPFELVTATAGYVVKRRFDFRNPAGWLLPGLVLGVEGFVLYGVVGGLESGIYS